MHISQSIKKSRGWLMPLPRLLYYAKRLFEIYANAKVIPAINTGI